MSKKVLLVDDEKDFLETLSERMTLSGLDVMTCSKPKEALKMARDEDVDVIVLDLKMPEMDGIEFLKAVKDLKPELQVILLTGHATLEKGIQAAKLGALDVLEKPAEFETLLDRIKRASAKKLVIMEKKDAEKIHDIITERGW